MRKYKSTVLLIIFLMIVSILSLFVGVIDLNPAEILHGDFEKMEILLISRVPRLLAILCTGVGMSVAGLIMQQLCMNKFVSPTTGATISSAQFGILMALVFMENSTIWSRALFAAMCAVLGTWVFVWFIQNIPFKDPVLVPLVGIMFGNVIGGITSYIAYKYEMTQALSSWLTGSFSTILRGRYEIVWLTVPLVVLAFSIGAASIVFQTIINNTIVTPCLLGMNSLYSLIHTAAAFFLGTGSTLLVNGNLSFAVDLLLMGVAGTFIYSFIFKKTQYNVLYVLLIGTVLTSFFSSIQSTLVRVMDPNEYETLLVMLVASFSNVNEEIILFSVILMAVIIFLLRRDLAVLDVITLGREQAINLGVDYDRTIKRLLLGVVLFISIATALVGPISFLGLIIANLSRQLFKTYRHSCLIIGSALFGIILLIAGQLIVEQVYTYSIPVSVFITVGGGIYFLYLLLGNDGRCSIIGVEIGFENVGVNAEVDTSSHGNEASFEFVLDKNPDYIFAMDRDAAIGTEGAQLAAEVLDNELVNKTDAAQNGRVVVLEHSNVWYTAEGGITALGIMLSDLENVLLK